MAFRWFALGGQDKKSFEFRCSECSKIHRGSPSFSYKKPAHYFDIPDTERESRIKVSDDWCVIDDETRFIRALLEIPISGVDDPFSWGLWVTQSEASFQRYIDTFNEDQSTDGSFGWLTVTMPGYDRMPAGEPFEDLACDIEWQTTGQRPKIIIQEIDHPLYLDQRNGISLERAIELAKLYMHPEQ